MNIFLKKEEIEQELKKLKEEQSILCCAKISFCQKEWSDFFKNCGIFDNREIFEIQIKTINFFIPDQNDWGQPPIVNLYDKNRKEIHYTDKNYPDFLRDMGNFF